VLFRSQGIQVQATGIGDSLSDEGVTVLPGIVVTANATVGAVTVPVDVTCPDTVTGSEASLGQATIGLLPIVIMAFAVLAKLGLFVVCHGVFNVVHIGKAVLHPLSAHVEKTVFGGILIYPLGRCCPTGIEV